LQRQNLQRQLTWSEPKAKIARLASFPAAASFVPAPDLLDEADFAWRGECAAKCVYLMEAPQIPSTAVASSSCPFHVALRRYWGYDSFRPRQEEIVRSIAAGRDACVIMPTGGGKSLCYQLPAALAHGKTAVVISPLIALMQDQIAQLTQMGIPAASLNSSTPQSTRADIHRRAVGGEFRLLYLSPERVALDSAAEWLKTIPISFFAIDEAHCISEWGHDFRPEYRQLSRLRRTFPDHPIAAFTASATQRVRHDIITQLQLREPYRHIASFHRPNLRYIIKLSSAETQDNLLLETVRRTPQGSIIVYAPTIARVEEVAHNLEQRGITAVGYHGKMGNAERRANQEKWMADEVRVLVGTIAFGLGINKPSVRAVIHLGLPKGVEQYYQEAGRAGRDGLPADCVLLWQKRDFMLQKYFIDQIGDHQEMLRARQRFSDIQSFVDTPQCRQLQVCRYFGETPKWKGCGECDVCRGMPDWLDIQIKVARTRHGSRRRRRGAPFYKASPDSAETFTYDRDAAYMSSSTSLDSRQQASLPGEPKSEYDQLYEYMRQWRRDAAKRLDVAAFTVLFDSSLEALCRARPTTLDELRRVSGFGEKKLAAFGIDVLAALGRFAAGTRPTIDWRAKPPASAPARETIELLAQGHTFEDIARVRGRNVSTVVSLIAELIEAGEAQFQPNWMPPQTYTQIAEACRTLGTNRLKALKDALPEEITFEEIKLVVASLRQPPPPAALAE
jgi:ATP-dependent DNA helicase RecQ